MKNLLRHGLAKKVIAFAFLVGIVSPSALAYQDGGFPTGLVPVNPSGVAQLVPVAPVGIGQLVAAVAPTVQNLNVTTSTGSATVSFSLNTNATTTVWIKDTTGTIVKTLIFDNNLTGGTNYSYNWNGTDNNNAPVAAGSYNAQVVAYNSVSSDIKNFSFNYTAASTVQAPVVTVSVSPTSFDPTKGQTTTVSYSLSQEASLSVLVKLNGSLIKTLRAQTLQNPGSYTLSWNGVSDQSVTMGPNNFVVEVYANNVAGTDTKTAGVTIVNDVVTVTAPNLTALSGTPSPFNPNLEVTRIGFTLDKTANVTVDVLDAASGAVIKNLANGTSLSAGTYNYNWDGRNTSGAIVPNNTYRVRVMASNSAGSDTEFVSVITQSVSTTTAPDVTSVYATPTPFNPNTANTRVYLTLDKTADVTVTIMDGSNTIRTLVSNTSLPAGTYFYEWNGRDANGNLVPDKVYTAKVTATNSAGTDTLSANVQVSTSGTGGTCNTVTSNYVYPSNVNINNTDAQINYVLANSAVVTVRIKDVNGNLIRTLVSQSESSGSKVVSWNGRNSSGNLVNSGTYTYEITAVVSNCSDETETGSFYLTSGTTDNGYVNDWPSTDENLITNLIVSPEVFRPLAGERANISFYLNRSAKLRLEILNGTTVVKTIVNTGTNKQSSGTYSYTWDGRNNSGNLAADAVYQVRAMADDGSNTDTDRASVELDTDGIIIGFPTGDRCAGFKDVSVNSPFCKAIELMSKKRIFDGYSDGTFRPYEKINRAETAKVVVLALGYDVNTANIFGKLYPDTVAGAWYMPYLLVARDNDIATGYPDGTFRPSSTINRVELLRVFLEANHLSLSGGCPQPFDDTPITPDTNWYMKYACYAKYNGLMNSDTSSKLYPAEPMTRGDVATLFYDFEVKGLYSGTNGLNGFNNYYSNGNNCAAYDNLGNCMSYNTNNNNNSSYCTRYNSSGTCLSYSTNNTTCTQYNSNGTCSVYGTSTSTSYNNNSNSNGYYVYQNGQYVWVTY